MVVSCILQELYNQVTDEEDNPILVFATFD